jgi:hypothetical protein
MGTPLITPIGTDATPFRLPPPMPGTTAYANAVWTLAPPPAGTDDLLGAAPPLPLPPHLTMTELPPVVRRPPLPIVRVGTPFVDAIGFRNPFLD